MRRSFKFGKEGFKLTTLEKKSNVNITNEKKEEKVMSEMDLKLK